MGHASSRILNQVIALIEPLTRFDRSSVHLRSESEQTIQCTGIWTATIRFSSKTTDGAGRLPSGIRDASSQSDMERAIEDVLASERAQVASRLQRWSEAQVLQPAASHSPLTANDCISGTTRIGYTWSCSTCGGKGKVSCSRCHGRMRITCSICNGAGHTQCHQCSGKGRKTCTYCNGQRRISRQESIKVWNAAANEYSTTYETVWEHCMQCQEGTVQCHACTGGKNYCVTCSRSGQVQCPECLATGLVTCSKCSGKGALHRYAETQCTVNDQFAVRSTDGETEAAQTMATWDFRTFTSIASVSTAAPAITATQLTRTYPATLQLTRAGVLCAGQEFDLLGYGSDAQVFDFKGLVGHLLSQDLNQLQTALSSGSRDDLRVALTAMLASEVNQQLVDPAQRSSLVANGTVTSEQAETTASTLRKAMGRLYNTPAAVGLATFVVLLVGALEYLLYSGWLLPWNRVRGLGIFAIVVAVTSVGIELVCRQLVLSKFVQTGAGQAHKAAARLLQATGTLKHWRWASVVATVLTMVCFFYVVTHRF